MCGFASAFSFPSYGSPKLPIPLKMPGNELISTDPQSVILLILVAKFRAMTWPYPFLWACQAKTVSVCVCVRAWWVGV